MRPYDEPVPSSRHQRCSRRSRRGRTSVYWRRSIASVVDESTRSLAIVGLEDRADDVVKRYSLGMKQRLGLAAALLKDPDLLMLDEPANGLDPAGMRGVRQLLRQLADDGRTVFVSSHILAEIESTCDRVAILAKGRLVTHGTVEEVISTAGHRASVLVKVDDLDLGVWALAHHVHEPRATCRCRRSFDGCHTRTDDRTAIAGDGAIRVAGGIRRRPAQQMSIRCHPRGCR